MKRYDLMNQINTRGTFLTSKKCLPFLLKAENPHILNLSPPLDMNPKWFANSVAYSIAKFGMSLCVLGMAEEFKELLLNKSFNIESIGEFLHHGWHLKRRLANTISSTHIDKIYSSAIESGALGGKIVGAGGGGFLMLIVPDKAKSNVKTSLNKLMCSPVSYDPRGTRVLSIVT